MNSSLHQAAATALLAAIATNAHAQTCSEVDRQPATETLVELVGTDTTLKYQLTQSIALGQRINPDPNTNPVAKLEDYYGFIDALTTYDPRNIMTGASRDGIRVSMDGKNYCNWNILDLLSYSYFLVDRQLTTDPRGQIQFQNEGFSNWMRQIAEYWGRYLETEDSAKYVPNFENDPSYGDWYCPGEPYASYQAFFTRELCPETFPTGSRPVQGYGDPKTVVSIGDSTSAGWWPISRSGKLVTGYDGVAQSGRAIKGKLYNDIAEFILGGPEEKVLKTFGEIDPSRFNGGTFTHQFLNVNNYHRLHTPVAGKLVYMRHIQAGVRMKAGWVEALGQGEISYYDPRDTPDWQFGQTRLVLGIETADFGTVIAVPMGMAQVSAIRPRDWVQLGAQADKGWEFANFAFGGSDFVILFEPKAEFVLTVPTLPEPAPGAGASYRLALQGEKYGCLGGRGDCSQEPGTPPKYPGMQ